MVLDLFKRWVLCVTVAEVKKFAVVSQNILGFRSSRVDFLTSRSNSCQELSLHGQSWCGIRSLPKVLRRHMASPMFTEYGSREGLLAAPDGSTSSPRLPIPSPHFRSPVLYDKNFPIT
jgi:hypothetical protein